MVPMPSPKGGRSVGTIVAIGLMFAVPLTGIGWGVYAWTQAEDEAEETRQEVIDAIDDITIPQISIPELSIPEITVPQLSVPEVTLPQVTVPVASSIPPADSIAPATTAVAETVPVTVPVPVSLFDGTQASDVVAAFEATVSGDPSRFNEIVLYPTYAFATAQDAAIPQNLDEFPWRDGVVGASSPVMIVGDGDIEPTLFTAAEIDWTQIPRLVAESPALTTVAEPEVTHVIVSRSTFIEGMPLTVRVYVSDARSSSYVEWSAAGEVLKVV